MRRSLQDDKNSIKVNFLEPLTVEELFILDTVPMNKLFQKGPPVSHSTLERLEPGSFQEMDIVRLLQKKIS